MDAIRSDAIGVEDALTVDEVTQEVKIQIDYDYLKWKDGTVRGPKKGERVVCVGEESDWYKVKYANGVYYIFKQYAKKVK